MRQLNFDGNAALAPIPEVEEVKEIRQLNTEMAVPSVEEDIVKKVAILYQKKERYNELTKQYKNDTKKLSEQIAVLEDELREYAQTNKVKKFDAGDIAVSFTARNTRSIQTRQFLAFLKKHNRLAAFYELAAVKLTETIKQFGEAVLEAEGVISVSCNPYSSLKLKLKG